MNIDATISAAMQESFFEFFSVEIGTSVETGYDWTQISTEAKSEVHTYTVSTVVKPGR